MFQRISFALACLLVCKWTAAAQPPVVSTNAIPSLEEALAAHEDVWGLAAMRQRDGPNYDFFARLLPPLRYVNADFRYYPIILSAVTGPWKARLVSNGSALNARAKLDTWNEVGTPVTFRVGGDELFGGDPRRLDGPHLERGFLPIVHFSYQHDHLTYDEQAFASVEPALATCGVVYMRFGLRGGGNGQISATFVSAGPLRVLKGTVQTTNSEVLAWFDETWHWDASGKRLVASLSSGGHANLVIATKPMDAEVAASLSIATRPLSRMATFEMQHRRCANDWQNVLAQGMHLDVPESRVNDAWRALTISLFTEARGNDLNYSTGNAYDRIYEAETGDAVGALALWGHEGGAAAMLRPLLGYNRDKLKFHNAGFKLQALAQYYWLTRDTNFIQSARPQWQTDLESIIAGRERESGLLPREQYCGDIATDVYSLNSNSAAWRGLRDFGAILADMGDQAEAQRLSTVAAQFRAAILAAVAKSEQTDVQPNFIPVALFGDEKSYETLTASKLGSYWDLMAPYVLGSGVFAPGSARERAIMDYLQERGGLFMGMIRFDQHSGLFANESAVDDLYGLRYVMKLLERDDADRALVSFYGKLAQGLTRETFVGAEGTGLKPLDEFGRPMYLPPNSTAQAYFLWMLRHLLVQDWDLDDDGAPDTLCLCFATPRQWLADGDVIHLERAPTAFGPVSVRMQSFLKRGEVVANLDLPTRNPAKKILLRARLPDGWRVTSAKAGGKMVAVDERGTVDLSSLKGRVTVRFQVGQF